MVFAYFARKLLRRLILYSVLNSTWETVRAENVNLSTRLRQYPASKIYLGFDLIRITERELWGHTVTHTVKGHTNATFYLLLLWGTAVPYIFLGLTTRSLKETIHLTARSYLGAAKFIIRCTIIIERHAVVHEKLFGMYCIMSAVEVRKWKCKSIISAWLVNCCIV